MNSRDQYRWVDERDRFYKRSEIDAAAITGFFFGAMLMLLAAVAFFVATN